MSLHQDGAVRRHLRTAPKSGPTVEHGSASTPGMRARQRNADAKLARITAKRERQLERPTLAVELASARLHAAEHRLARAQAATGADDHPMRAWERDALEHGVEVAREAKLQAVRRLETIERVYAAKAQAICARYEAALLRIMQRESMRRRDPAQRALVERIELPRL